MGDVLQGAAALCLCKLAYSLVSLPWLSTSHSPISFCCSCLLIFTDFLVTVFLSFLYIFQSWLPDLTGDAIALRFLLFLSHLYGGVLLLIIPLIAVDTLYRVLGSDGSTTGPTAGSGGQRRSDVTAEQRGESNNLDKDQCLFHIGCYLCCLWVWVTVSLNVRWRWKLEEVWSVTCLQTTGSLIRCLPRLFNPIPIVADPCWCVVFLFLLLMLVTVSTGLHRRHQAPEQADMVHTATNGGKDLAPVGPESSVSDPAQFVDPRKTQSSCSLHREHFCVQMPTRHHGDSQKHKRTKGGTALTFLPAADEDPQHTSHYRWGFPRWGASVMMGLVLVLSIFVLPLNLSVNIVVIRTIETLLELGVKLLVSFASNTIEIAARMRPVPVRDEHECGFATGSSD